MVDTCDPLLIDVFDLVWPADTNASNAAKSKWSICDDLKFRNSHPGELAITGWPWNTGRKDSCDFGK